MSGRGRSPRAFAPSAEQLEILFGRVLRIGREDLELSPNQAKWMGLRPPTRRSCPGCVLFGTCALHDVEREA